jgi:hypothetical protein
MADSHPFSNAGLGMFGTAEKSFAARGMQGGSSNDGFLGELLSVLGFGDNSKKADAANPASNLSSPAASFTPNYSLSPSGVAPKLGMNPVAPVQNNAGVAPVLPSLSSPAATWDIDAEKQKNQQIINNLVPRNLTAQ